MCVHRYARIFIDIHTHTTHPVMCMVALKDGYKFSDTCSIERWEIYFSKLLATPSKEVWKKLCSVTSEAKL